MEDLAATDDPLLACCLCRHLLQEAVQLTCLHNCCEQCFSTAASKSSSQGASCGSCGAFTQAGSEQPNHFIDSQVLRYKLIAESKVCSKCKENGERDMPALMWCPTCRHSLCGNCHSGHRQYFRQHVTQSLEELRNPDDVCLQSSPTACPIHKKPLEIACLNCEKAMCISCWAECKEKKHEMYIVGQEAFDAYVGKFIASISTIECELLQKSELLQKPKNILRDTKAARDGHLEELKKRKRRVVEVVETVYQGIEFSIKNAYDDLKADAELVASAADRIASDLLDARNYVRRLVESNEKCDILNQQKMVHTRLSVLSAELDSLRDRLSMAKREVKLEASVPEDLEDVVRPWIGMPLVYLASSSAPAPQQPHAQQQEKQQQQQQQQQQCFSFGAASVSVQLPVQCWDVALTKDGRSLLFAARQHGLLEFSSSSGRELSRWRPPKHRNGKEDEVWAVTSLSEGRAAVSLLYAQLIVLLRRNEQGGGAAGSNWWKQLAVAVTGDAWSEDRRDPLPWSALRLAAHGDVLAASQLLGPGLQLLSLSSGRRLSDAELQREYFIGSLAVAAAVVVTGSYDKVELGKGRRAGYVLDAHSVAGGSDEQLWRYVLSSGDEEQLWGVCADSSGGCLYAAMWKAGSGHVSALSLGDGSELRRVALGFDSAAAPRESLRPWRLSLSDDSAAVAEQQRQSSSGGGGCSSPTRGSSSSSSSSGGRAVLLLAVLSTTKKMATVHCSKSDGASVKLVKF